MSATPDEARLLALMRTTPDFLGAICALLKLGAHATATSVSATPWTAPAYSFKSFCTDRTISVSRPGKGKAIAYSTWDNYDRLLRQMGFLNEDGSVARAADWGFFKEFVSAHDKGRTGCATHRKAMLWFSTYCGIPVPEWATRPPDKREWQDARNDGLVTERQRFFRPTELQALVAVNNGSHTMKLNRDVFRIIVYTSLYVGPRSGELWFLKNKDVRLDSSAITIAANKQSKRRVVQPFESYALLDRTDPTLWRYVHRVRPLLDPEGKFSGPDDPFFLFVNERTGQTQRWPTEDAFQAWVARGIHAVLGDDVAVGHGFRRACCTFRYHAGMSLEQVAQFIGDTPSVVWNSYLDHEWLNSPQGRIQKAGKAGALIPRLRPDHFGSLSPPRKGALKQGERDDS